MKRSLACLIMLLTLSVFSSTAFAEATKDGASALVKKAAAYFKTNGKEKLIAEINNPSGQFVKGELYLFAQNFDGLMLAHGSNPKLVGKNLGGVKDSDGKLFFQEFVKTAKQGGGWVDYKWTNPVSKKIESKTTYVYSLGDIFVGCGIYK